MLGKPALAEETVITLTPSSRICIVTHIDPSFDFDVLGAQPDDRTTLGYSWVVAKKIHEQLTQAGIPLDDPLKGDLVPPAGCEPGPDDVSIIQEIKRAKGEGYLATFSLAYHEIKRNAFEQRPYVIKLAPGVPVPSGVWQPNLDIIATSEKVLNAVVWKKLR